MHTVGTITCHTIDDFVAVIAGLVREGVTFEADTLTQKITLTGGY